MDSSSLWAEYSVYDPDPGAVYAGEDYFLPDPVYSADSIHSMYSMVEPTRTGALVDRTAPAPDTFLSPAARWFLLTSGLSLHLTVPVVVVTLGLIAVLALYTVVGVDRISTLSPFGWLDETEEGGTSMLQQASKMGVAVLEEMGEAGKTVLGYMGLATEVQTQDQQLIEEEKEKREEEEDTVNDIGDVYEENNFPDIFAVKENLEDEFEEEEETFPNFFTQSGGMDDEVNEDIPVVLLTRNSSVLDMEARIGNELNETVPADIFDSESLLRMLQSRALGYL